MRGIVFIAFLYSIGLMFLGVGLADVFLITRFALLSEQGTMTSSDPVLTSVAKLPPEDLLYGTNASVVYATPEGRIEVPHRMSGAIAKRLASGESIPVRFLRSDPDSAIYDGRDQRPVNWVAIFGGAIALALAVFAHRLRRREAGL